MTKGYATHKLPTVKFRFSLNNTNESQKIMLMTIKSLSPQVQRFLIKITQVMFVIGLLMCSIKIVFSNHSDWGNDFFNFWALGNYVHVHPGKEIYGQRYEESMFQGTEIDSFFINDEKGKRLIAFRKQIGIQLTGSPLMYSITSFFRFNSFEKSFLLFKSVQLTFLICSFLAICFWLKISTTVSLIGLFIYMLTSQSLHFDLAVGNINQLQFFVTLIGFFFLHKKKYFFFGTIVATSILLKVNYVFLFVPVALYLLFKNSLKLNLRIVYGIIAALIAEVGATQLLFSDIDVWRKWIDLALIPIMVRSDYMNKNSNLALAQLVHEATSLNITYVSIVFFVLWLLICFKFTSQKIKNNDDNSLLALFSLGTLGLLVFPKIVWYHYQSIIFISLLFFIKRIRLFERREIFSILFGYLCLQWSPYHFNSTVVSLLNQMIIFYYIFLMFKRIQETSSMQTKIE